MKLFQYLPGSDEDTELWYAHLKNNPDSFIVHATIIDDNGCHLHIYISKRSDGSFDAGNFTEFVSETINGYDGKYSHYSLKDVLLAKMKR